VRRFAVTLIILLALAPAAEAAVTLGVYGGASRFQSLTGQRSVTKHLFSSWGQKTHFLDKLFRWAGPVPMIAVQTTRNSREVVTPREIARGKGDAYLVRLSKAAARFGKRAYIRPMAEMNGHWTPYCAYNANGTKRGRSHSQGAFRDAFRRIYIIVHGGSRASMNGELKRYGMPGVRTSLPSNPQVRVIWNPQGFGSPNVRGNMPAAYWPGARFVDVVGNDIYDIRGRAMWEAADNLYDAHPNKPYAFPEWGLWGIDHPAFIRDMRRFVRTHPRTDLLVWYNGDNGSIFDLKSKPASRRAYRRYITPLGR
jgi:hypothetical protein